MADIADVNFISKAATVSAKKTQKKEQIFVVKIKCLPYGFFEKQLWEFFTQFGEVIRARVARSTKTGKHKGWAYVGFENKEVAEIAAETMNGYLMFEKRLLCHVMEKVPKCMESGPRYVAPPHMRGQAKKDAVKRNKNVEEKQSDKLLKKRTSAFEKQAQKLKDMGVEYDLSTVPSLSNVTKKAPAGKDAEAEPEVVAVVSAEKKKKTAEQPKTPKRKVAAKRK